MTIGERLRVTRQQAGMTQKQVAIACGMADSAIRKYESGIQKPKVETIERLAVALGVTPTYLIGYDEKIIKPEQYTPEQLAEFRAGAWEAYQQHIAESTGPQARANAAMNQMTTEGQGKVADYAEDILPRYRAAGATPAPSECSSTTLPPDAPTAPPEGK